jgi:hypothetical protein
VPFPQLKGIDYGKIDSDPSLSITKFTGLSVVALKERTNHFAQDTYTIMRRLLLHFPQDSSVIDLHLASASLAHVLGYQNWENHLLEAEELATGENRAKVQGIGEHIKTLSVK